jgi:predicted acetyltransferase
VTVEIRGIAPDEVELWLRADEARWGDPYEPERLAVYREFIEPERSLAAVDEGQFVGSATIMTSSLGLPGGRVPAAAVTFVSVHPTHRRRGLLRAMMLRQLADIHEAGVEPVAMLGASESVIYRRFGYGMASVSAHFEIETARAGFARPHQPEGRVEIVDLETFMRLAPDVYRRLSEEGDGIPGTIGRPPAYWRTLTTDAPSLRDGMGHRLYAVHHGSSGVDGYVMYRLGQKWTDGLADYTLRVEEMLATTGDPELTLWRYCLDHDLVRRVQGGRRPIDETLVHRLADPRQLKIRVFDDLWIRVVDVARALSGRRYPVSDSLVLDVSDEVCPQVAGRWRLDGSPDGAECARTDASADIALDGAALGSLLCGGFSAEPLARAGLIDELHPGAIVRAARLFGWYRAPWNLGEF